MNPVIQYDSAIADKPTAASTACQKCRYASNATASLVLCRNTEIILTNTYDAVTDSHRYPNARIVREYNMACEGFDKKLNWFQYKRHSFK